MIDWTFILILAPIAAAMATSIIIAAVEVWKNWRH